MQYYNLPEATDDILEVLFSVVKEKNLFRHERAVVSGKFSLLHTCGLLYFLGATVAEW